MPLSSPSIRKHDSTVFKMARSFLANLDEEELTKEVIESYLVAPAKERPRGLPGLYFRLLRSAQNANMKAGVIGGSIGGIENLKHLLDPFTPRHIIERYGSDEDQLLRDVIKKLQPAGRVRQTSRSLWPRYCKTILSAANFMAQFRSANDFYAWVDFFDGDSRARPGLPMIISREVDGIGFALACDFLKELGYANFGKPDVHVRDIFEAAGLCEFGASDYELFKTICRVADHAKTSPFTVDKVFWLIGSGYFYNHPHIGRAGRVSRPKKRFIALMQGSESEV